MIIRLILFLFLQTKPSSLPYVCLVPAIDFSATSDSISAVFFEGEGYQLTIVGFKILKLLKVVSSLTHPSNVKSKRGLQRVQHVHVCIVRKGKYIRKKKPALHLKKKTANKL